jgi:hypothetical protein
MKRYTAKIGIIKIEIDNPNFRVKNGVNKPISQELERIKRIIRKRFKSRIKDYYHDIIIHIADNHEQEHLINDILNVANISLRSFFESIINYKYAVAKFSTQNMSKIFPDEIVLGKDVDILCSQSHYERIVQLSRETSNVFCLLHNSFSSKSIIKENGILIRIEQNENLIFQFDISNHLGSKYKNGFSEICLESAIDFKGIKILSLDCESCVRAVEYFANIKKKKHHLKFLKTNLTDDIKLFISGHVVNSKQILNKIEKDIKNNQSL